MNVTYKEYEMLTEEGKSLYDSLAIYYNFNCKPDENTKKEFYKRISVLSNESDKRLLLEFVDI
jgi:hypothetical protein